LLPEAIEAPFSKIVEGAVIVRVPPQTPLVAVETVRPAGRESVMPTPVSATVLAVGLTRVKVRVEVPPPAMVVGLKAMPTVGGATTAMLAFAAAPFPPCVDVTLPVVNEAVPAAVPVTFTVTAHEPEWVMLPPDRLMLDAPALAVTIPPHVLLMPGVAATIRVPVEDGSVTLTPTPVRSPPETLLGLLICTVKVVLPLSGMLGAPKAAEMVGGATTVMFAVDVLLLPKFEVSVADVLTAPAVMPWTVTEMEQEPLPARLAPEKLMELEVALAVPPHVLFTLAGLTT